MLRRHADESLAAAIPLHSRLDLFRTALASVHDGDTPTPTAVARRTAVSPRTLQRRLDEHATTWSDEAEHLRRERSCRGPGGPAY
ncbi:hypothetical protein [Streptomyces sp. NPDC090445]|uniref:hypothetical protein n=1 Tax=Streptomyces sp. NPDC090445 TaxID=3365963 RepID=UPI0037F8D04D